MAKAIEAPVNLPSPISHGKMSVEEAISKRRSVRRFSAQPLTLEHLSQLLWSAQGITGTGGRRAVPSAGATYPLEVFAVVGDHAVPSLAAGIYHYNVDSHSLSLHKKGDSRPEIAEAALGQSVITTCPVDIIICALYTRTAYRYGKRGETYVHIEVGHASQNISLQAVALGLATVMIGAFDDKAIRKILKVEEQIKPLYIIPVGKPV
jgi:SagB-type dehydrogenase family enzyme